MKKLLLILLLVLAGEISAQQVATIVVKTTPDNEIAYWPTGKEHLFCIALGTKAQAGPLGEFVHQFRTDRPGMVQVWTQGSDSFTLYLTPGSKDTITVTKDTLIISGTNSAYNRCLKTVNDYQKYSDKLVYMQPHELRGITSLEQYHRLADARMRQALDAVNASGLNEEFLAEQRAHIDYIRRSIFIHIARQLSRKEKLPEDWQRELTEVINSSVNGDYLRSYRGIGFFVNDLVMLSRAICQQPEIIVLDEPTSYLDIKYKLEFLSILQRLKRQKNLTVIMSLHELDMAKRVSDHILCIDGRYVDRYGTPEEVFTDQYVSGLFGITAGSFDETGEDLELEKPDGMARVFVIAGGGLGRKSFRSLQRKGIPFATGIIYENDLDYPAAKALSAEIVSARSFEPVDDALIEKAKELIDGCEGVICDRTEFGTYEQFNSRLYEYAVSTGKIIKIPFLEEQLAQL